jgi:hypothetical protein
LSDKENMDTTEDEVTRLKNDEGDSADVEGHRLMNPDRVMQSDDGEDSDAPDVEAHRNVTKTSPRNTV